MLTRDPYDVQVAFADVLGAAEPVDLIDMAGACLRRVGRRRLRTAPPQVVGVDHDPTATTFEPEVVLIGDNLPTGQFPLYEYLHRRFRNAMGQPKYVRVDGEADYRDFRDERRQPYLASLEARLARVERALDEHVADHHGGFGSSVAAFEAYLDGHRQESQREADVLGVLVETVHAGKVVPLDLPGTAPQTEAWLDGDEVLVSTRLRSGDIATTGGSVEDAFSEVVECAEQEGAPGPTALLLGCALGPKLAARRLVGDLWRSVGCLGSAPFVGVLTPQSNPAVAAALALLQRAQAGDRNAIREATRLHRGQGRELIDSAREHLMLLQAENARGRLSPTGSGRRHLPFVARRRR